MISTVYHKWSTKVFDLWSPPTVFYWPRQWWKALSYLKSTVGSIWAPHIFVQHELATVLMAAFWSRKSRAWDKDYSEDIGRIVENTERRVCWLVGVFVMHCFIYESMGKLRNFVFVKRASCTYKQSFNKPIEIVVVFRVSLFLIVQIIVLGLVCLWWFFCIVLNSWKLHLRLGEFFSTPR